MKEILKKLDMFCDKIRDFTISLIKNYYHYIVILITLVLFLIASYGMRDVVTNDVRSFLTPWYTNFYNDGFVALGNNFGDYTPSYMYFLWFVSLFKIAPPNFMLETPDLTLVYWIKGYSLIYQLIASVFIYLIAKKITNNKLVSSIGFALSLFVPTLMLNSSFWGQCDAIYTCFIIIGIYFLIKEKTLISTIFISLSFCYKLQSIFFIPVLLLLFLNKKYKLRYLLLIPLIYIISCIPSFIAGKGFIEAISVYFNQIGASYKELTLNCSSLWAIMFRNFMQNEHLELYSVMLALLVTGAFALSIFIKKIPLNTKNIITISYLFALVMPFVMPHMHDRYYYLADLLAILFIIINPKKFYIGILSLLISFGGYTAYLWSYNLFWSNTSISGSDAIEMSFRIGSYLMIIAISLLTIYLFKDNKQEENI